MKESVFIDTGYWIALFDKRDKNHLVARQGLEPLLANNRLCLSDFILFETITYLNCSVKRHDLAIRFLKKAREPVLEMFVVDAVVKADALNVFEKYSDKNLSVTDCTSFVLMSQQGIQQYAGFDDHFIQMGFSRAIEP
jgi:uncharacterized protein